MMKSEPSVFVIVLNYDGKNYLNNCLSSLLQQTYQNFKIIVFDNASVDGSIKYLRANYPEITTIQSKVNLGFAEGNNEAIKYALGQGADYVFLVNNDTESESGLIEELVNTSERDSTIGISAPRVFDLKNRGQIQEMGVGIDKFGYPSPIVIDSENHTFFFVSGCAMLIRSEMLRKIGTFDEKFFMFAEDLDLCWRARLAGYILEVSSNAKIYHASGGSISGGVIKESSYKTSVKRVFLREKNTIRTLIKNYGFYNMIKFVPFYIGLLSFETFFWVCVLKPNTSTNILKAILWNIKVLPETYKRRTIVQNLRKTREDEIVAKMLDGYCKLNVFRAVGLPDFGES